MRVVFLGSGTFAVPILDALRLNPRVTSVTVVTTPPRPAGRRGELRPTPVGARAAELGLPLLEPTRLRDPNAITAIGEVAPDLLVLADYGRIVPAALLELPPHGALNLHPSLLPRHRGATPIPAAILAGDARTGVTLMRMDAGVDTGPIVAQVSVDLAGNEFAPELEAHLAEVAARLLDEALPPWLDGASPAVPQPSVGATLTRPLSREDGRLDPGRPAVELERQVRALQPWPGSFLDTDDGRLIVWRARVASAPGGAPTAAGGVAAAVPIATEDRLVAHGAGLALVCDAGLLELLEVQPAGRRRMPATEYLRGRRGPLHLHPAVEGPSDASAVR